MRVNNVLVFCTDKSQMRSCGHPEHAEHQAGENRDMWHLRTGINFTMPLFPEQVQK